MKYCNNKKVYKDIKRPLLFAHRGVSSLAPENTLSAFKKVVELGIPGVELDVHLTKDGKLVVIHDESIKRTGRIFNSEKNELQIAPDITVEESTYEYLLQFDFGIWFNSDFAGEKLPLLSEVLDVLGPAVYVDIEIKIDTLFCRNVARKTASVLHEYLEKYPQNPHRFMVSSFNPFAINCFSKYSNIPTALIYENKKTSPFIIRNGRGMFFSNPVALKPCWDIVTGKENKEVFVWTVDDVEFINDLQLKNVQGFCSNKPQILKKKL